MFQYRVLVSQYGGIYVLTGLIKYQKYSYIKRLRNYFPLRYTVLYPNYYSESLL